MRWLRGSLAALPDLVTAGFFVSVWLSPLTLGPNAVKAAVLIMLVEFVLVHSSGFIGLTAVEPKLNLFEKLRRLMPVLLIYSLFIAAFALAWQEWWPILAFAWLIVGKLQLGMDRSLPSEIQAERIQGFWGLSVVLYLIGAFLTVLMPIPRLGMIHDSYGLPGSGHWISFPHTVVFFGVFYFTLLALVRLWESVKFADNPATSSH
jgi:hypothetical protein